VPNRRHHLKSLI